MTTHALPPLRIVPHQFTPADLCAGHFVLDFVNTAAGLNRDPRDWLDSYVRLTEWAELAGILSLDRAHELIALNQADPSAGERALGQARLLRSALYDLLHSSRGERPPSDAALMELQRFCRHAGAVLELRRSEDGSLKASLESCGLDQISAMIATTAADLLSEPLSGQIGVCAGHNCGWVFLDRSKSRRRRWCDMKTCGNAAKVSRHYRKKRSSAAN